MRIISLKIPRKISTVGSTHHRWMWGIERYLEQLMIFRGLQNISNNYEARKTTLAHV